MNEKQNILYIKNMVCNRCIKVVREELEKIGLTVLKIFLGEVEVKGEINLGTRDQIKSILELNGFELIEDKNAKLIEGIKNFIIQKIHRQDFTPIGDVKFSTLIEKHMGKEYNYLSSLFSSTEGITIEHFIILQKVEKAKELFKYGELTMSEIAYRLGYSSVAHLSNQFKKVTGLTASQFKNITNNLRKPLDKVGI
ncbi:MAG: AraC family transcriptional regulator [bacterium]